MFRGGGGRAPPPFVLGVVFAFLRRCAERADAKGAMVGGRGWLDQQKQHPDDSVPPGMTRAAAAWRAGNRPVQPRKRAALPSQPPPLSAVAPPPTLEAAEGAKQRVGAFGGKKRGCVRVQKGGPEDGER